MDEKQIDRFFSSFLLSFRDMIMRKIKPGRTPRRHCRHCGLTTQNKDQM